MNEKMIGEPCADCGKEIGMLDASYYRKDPAGGMGKSYHSMCGDPFGIKAKDAEIKRCHEEIARLSALPPLRAREEIARIAAELDAEAENLSPERGNSKGQTHPAPELREWAEQLRALFTAGQEWRDRIGEALLPFGLLARRYDHHKAPDDEIVRSHGTLGKPGDRGYTHITVSDLRRAATLLDELAAAEPIVADKSQS